MKKDFYILKLSGYTVNELILEEGLLMKTYAFFNQKGGVGKTTSAVLFIDYFLNQGKKVLAIDADPQSSLTTVLCGDAIPALNLYHYFSRQKSSLRDSIFHVSNMLDILPAHISMAKLGELDSSELIKIKMVFELIFKDYDIVIIDSPPNLGTFSRLSLLLADQLFIPLQSTQIAYDALGDALSTVDNMAFLNPKIKKFIAFENQHQKRNLRGRNTIRSQYESELGEHWFQKRGLPQSTTIEERMMDTGNLFSSQNIKAVDSVKDFFDSLLEYSNG